jgi:hypothetical protein
LERQHDSLLVPKGRRPGTNAAKRALKLGLISLVATVLAMTGLRTASAAAAGGVNIDMGCQAGITGSGTYRVTANGSTSAVTVACGGSALVTNPSWMPGAMATIDQTAGPAGTILITNRHVTLYSFPASFHASAVPRAANYLLPLVLIVSLVMFLVTFPLVIWSQIWLVGQRIKYVHRLYIDQPDAYRDAVKRLALMPGSAWRIRLRSKLLRVPLPPGFEDAEQVIREDKQRV